MPNAYMNVALGWNVDALGFVPCFCSLLPGGVLPS